MVSCVCVQAPSSLDVLNGLFQSLLSIVEQAQFCSGGMGGIEDSLLESGNELLRSALELAVQAKADAVDSLHCPVCGSPLERRSCGHSRTVRTRFGVVRLERCKGWCPKCQAFVGPAAVGGAGLANGQVSSWAAGFASFQPGAGTSTAGAAGGGGILLFSSAVSHST